jgi:MFS family permease
MAHSPTATDRAAASPPARPRILTRSFVLLCAAAFLGNAHGSLLTPTLPLFIQEQGGTATFVGLVAAAFSAPSFLFRPFIGRAVDVWSARGVMAIGTLVLGAAGASYLMYQAVVLLLVRAIHGVAWAGYNTGANVLVARVAPPARRGEAVGYFTTAQGVAYAVMPAVALWLLSLVGFTGVFLVSSGAGLLAAAAVWVMPSQPQGPAQARSESFWAGLVERSALLPSALELLTKLPTSATSIFIPLYATFRGIAVESLVFYFLAVGIASVATRGLFGSWSDRMGRGWVTALGALGGVLALLLLSQAADIVVLTVGGALSGAATAASGPTVMALAIDRSRPDRRGAAMATYSMAFQLAQGGGALLWGVLIEAVGYTATYLVAALAPLAALVLIAKSWRAMAAPSKAAG